MAKQDEADGLFVLPLTEFTTARNELAARLKKSGQPAEAARVKALVKPPISAWAVNQLFWKHPKAFDRLVSTGQRFREAQGSILSGKPVDIRDVGETRRSALQELSRIAATVLGEAGHSPSQDVMRRIAITLEAISAYAGIPGAPDPGRLTSDVDPPGFEVLASLVSGSGLAHPAKPAPQSSAKPVSGRKDDPAQIAAAKASLQQAEETLTQVRRKAKEARISLSKAETDFKQADRLRVEAEDRFKKARSTAEEAGRHAQDMASQVEKLDKEVETAEKTLEARANEVHALTGARLRDA